MRAVNPARIDTQRISGVEQVAHGERAVFQMCGHAAVNQHHHNGLGAIEGVAVAAHDLRVELRETLDGRGVGDGDKRHRLAAHAARCILAGFDNTCKLFGLDGTIAVVAAAAAVNECFDSLHGVSLRWRCRCPVHTRRA